MLTLSLSLPWKIPLLCGRRETRVVVMAGGYGERRRPEKPRESVLCPGLGGLAGAEPETHAGVNSNSISCGENCIKNLEVEE